MDLGQGLRPVTHPQEITHRAFEEEAQIPPWDPRVAFSDYWPCRDSGFGSHPLQSHVVPRDKCWG